jgi:sugar lactone lactonase YvrE
LEEKYGDRLAVIGIHSAKFTAEKNTENIRHAAARYHLRHPVANDGSFTIWRAYGVRAWPTVVLIDPKGAIVGAAEGEGNYEVLDRAIGRLVGKPERPAKAAAAAGGAAGEADLLYPGKVAAGGDPARLYIADTGRHRLVATDLDGRIAAVYGSGERGFADGAAGKARFDSPQGLALKESTLYVADTGNHSIRAIDLKTGNVSTAAGTGKQAHFRGGGGKARETALNSPWDLLVHKGSLIIAMAGSHQVWRMDLEKGRVEPWIGSELAQPSGLAAAGDVLYIADSESSAVRAFHVKADLLETLVGTGLFDFGDGEGNGGHVLQHPLAVAVEGKSLIVADTYNHRLKRLDPAKREVKNWLGTGEPGAEDGERPSFSEPSGLALLGGKLYVADTNNHRIRVVDLGSGKTSSLKLSTPPARP